MTLAVEKASKARRLNGHPEIIVRDNVSWDEYERILRDPEMMSKRMTYDEGRLVIMSPLPRHEHEKRLIGRMIEMLTFELDIPICSLSATTWRRKQLRKGLEPDECYYVQNEPKVRGKDRINLRRDPPPDLVVEVEVTHHPINKIAIYEALGVPEVWVYTGKKLRTLRLTDGGYEDVEYSVALPFLRPADFERFLERRHSSSEHDLLRAFQRWVLKLKKAL